MYKKIIFMFIVLLSSLFISCATTNTAEINQLVATNTRATTTIKDTVDNLNTIIDGSAERINLITEQSKNITDGIDRTIFLFGEYKSEVDRLLTEVNKLREEIKNQGFDYNNSIYNSSSNDSN